MTNETEHVGFSDVERPRLRPLAELDDYRVAKDDPDIRGWEVKSGGKKIGKVDDLIVDMGAMKVRYVDVKVDRDVFASAGRKDLDDERRHVLIPIGTARLDDEHDTVLVDQLDISTLGEHPAHELGRLDRDYETRLLGHYGRRPVADDQDFYRGEHFDQKRFFGSRRPGRENERYLTRSEERPAAGTRPREAGDARVSEHGHERR